ncbi:MAG TPA: hypothetical protein VF203_13345 [Burkholderiales bacterium]
MVTRPCRLLLLALLLAGAAFVRADEEAPRLFTVVASTPGAPGAAPAKLEILDRRGVQLAKTVVAAPTWIIEPEPVERAARPPERVVELYTGTPSAPALLCRVWLRYYARASGWVPYFRLEEEPLLARVHGRWQPLELIRGAGGVLVLHGSTVPNAEGYYPRLEFGSSVGPVAIVAWQVR